MVQYRQSSLLHFASFGGQAGVSVFGKGAASVDGTVRLVGWEDGWEDGLRGEF
jgi:hypothetical protein